MGWNLVISFPESDVSMFLQSSVQLDVLMTASHGMVVVHVMKTSLTAMECISMIMHMRLFYH